MTTVTRNLEVDTLTVNSGLKTKELTSNLIKSVGFGSVQLGRGSNAYGENSIALGVGTEALADNAIAIGSSSSFYRKIEGTVQYGANVSQTYSLINLDGKCSASGEGSIALGSLSVYASGDNSIAINSTQYNCSVPSSGEINIFQQRVAVINGTTTATGYYRNAESGATLIGNRHTSAEYADPGKGGVLVGVGLGSALSGYSNANNSLVIGSRFKVTGDYSIGVGFGTDLTSPNTLHIRESGSDLDVKTNLVGNTTVTNLSDNGNGNNIEMPLNYAAAALEINLGGNIYKIPLYT